jgi:hypothetical protein
VQGLASLVPDKHKYYSLKQSKAKVIDTKGCKNNLKSKKIKVGLKQIPIPQLRSITAKSSGK